MAREEKERKQERELKKEREEGRCLINVLNDIFSGFSV